VPCGSRLAIIHHDSLDETVIQQMQTDVAAAAAQTTALPVILDMSNVSFVPSIGLGVLVKLMRSFKKEGRRFILVGLQPQVRATLAITHLDKLLEIYPRFEGAVQRLRSVT
jgi:anti-anti-sigma factor